MANSKFGVVRTDNVKATKDGNIKSARFYSSGAEAPVENGHLVKVDGLVDGGVNRELWKAVAPGAVDATNLYVVATPEIIYDETLTSSGALNKFKNDAGENVTLIGLEAKDIISISDECIEAVSDKPEEGNYVIPHATSTKWQEAEDADGSEFYGKIIAREIYKSGEYLNVIHIEKVQ